MKKINAKKKKKVVPKLEDDSKTDKYSDQQSPSKQTDIPDELETGEKTIRKSTRTSVIVRQAEREAIRAEKEATMKVVCPH
jgi:vacuolar protein sorting-associated protein 72